MKRKRIVLLWLLLCVALLGGCEHFTTDPFPEKLATELPGTSPVLPEVDSDTLPQQTRENAALYFRYLDEPYLAAEYRTITQLPSQSYEMALISELIAGPGTRSSELSGLFPPGVRVLSTVRQGRTLFVTLSQAIMNGYPDEPANWRESDTWKQELPLRRRLCMQALAATVTENCDVDQVQVLVQQDSLTIGSLRLQAKYFMDGAADGEVIGPLHRDPAMLLEPDTVLQVALTCWRSQDWPRLYRYLALYNPQTGAKKPAQRDFQTVMEQLPRIADFTFSGGSVSAQGSQATYCVTLSLLQSDGTLDSAEGKIIRLLRENGLWKITLEQLIGWLEE